MNYDQERDSKVYCSAHRLDGIGDTDGTRRHQLHGRLDTEKESLAFRCGAYLLLLLGSAVLLHNGEQVEAIDLSVFILLCPEVSVLFVNLYHSIAWLITAYINHAYLVALLELGLVGDELALVLGGTLQLVGKGSYQCPKLTHFEHFR